MLSENFSLQELTRTNITDLDNTPSVKCTLMTGDDRKTTVFTMTTYQKKRILAKIAQQQTQTQSLTIFKKERKTNYGN